MTNSVAIWLVILLVALLALDHLVLHWDIGLFAARKFMDLLGLLAFWR